MDVLFHVLLQYMYMIGLFMSLRRAIQCGDMIAIKSAYNIFLSLFEAAGKFNYVEIVLNQLKQYHNILTKQELHLLCCNCTARLYKSKSKCSVLYAKWPLDGIVELIQRYLHQMKFNPKIAGY